MHSHTRSRPWLSSPLFAAATGLLAALPSFAGCVFLTGAGHGVYVPAFMLFGPSCLLWVSEFGDRISNLALVACFLGLYAVYGLILSLGRLLGRGIVAFMVVLCAHYAAVFWLWVAPPERTGWDSIRRIGELLVHDPFFTAPLMVGLFELFVVMHGLACQYACSSIPYRPRFTKPMTVVLLVALCLGISFCGAIAWQYGRAP